MNKHEFIKELRAYLTENLPAASVEDSIRYYEDYIAQQVRNGQSEDQVIAALGDPRIIGKNVVDALARQKASGRPGEYASSGASASEGGSGRASGKSTLTGKLKVYGIIALVVLVILVVLIAVTKVLAFFFPLIAVIAIITLIFRRSGGGR